MKKFTALILMAVMLLSTACSSTPKANKFPLGHETVNTIITENKLPLTAEKLEITNDVAGLTVEYYNLKDNFTFSPVGSFSTADSQQGKAVSITNWAITGDFFAGGEYMDCAVKTVCAAYGQF
ncbi:MAG: hypothetical protein IKJ05_00280, partial [Oscillospiraceae bacterium]|nr:hypothetical protein [Oscillospiraceae bacterium]